MKQTRLNFIIRPLDISSFPFTSYSMLGFTDEVAKINRFMRWWSVSIELYLLFTKFTMETVFSHMYVDPNLQRYRRAMSGRAENRDGGRYFQKMVNSWLAAFTFCVCHSENVRVPLVARVPRVGYHCSRASFSRQFLLSKWRSQFLFLFFVSSSILLPSPTFSSETAFFILSVHFTRSILLHTHISNASSCFCSFRRSVQVSAPYNTTLHTKHFNSLFHSSFSKGPQKMLLFLLKSSFAIAILCFTSWQ